MRHMTQHRGGAATVGHRHRRTPWPPRSVSVQCMVCVVATSSLDVFESHTVALALSAGRGGSCVVAAASKVEVQRATFDDVHFSS
jgi:hypothetical protein